MKAALGALAALVALASCASPTHDPVVVGDSIMLGTQGPAALKMPGAVFDAQAGRGMNSPGIVVAIDGSWLPGTTGAEAAASIQAQRLPGGWTVIELGSNDLHLSPSQDEAAISAIMAQVPGCLAWVNVWSAGAPLRSKQFNVALVLAELKRTEPCTKVIDWATEARNRPSYLSPDGLHLTPSGSAWMAEMIQEATG